MKKLLLIPLIIILVLCLGGCNIDLSEQHQKDNAIAEKINAELESRLAVYGDICREVSLDRSNPGHYKFKFLKDDLDAQEIWNWTFKLLRVVEKAEGIVASGRSMLAIHGKMAGEEVVIGKLISGQTTNPVPYSITLSGSFADAQIVEDWKFR